MDHTKEIISAVDMQVEEYSQDMKNEKTGREYIPLPLANIASLGVAFEPLASLYQSIVSPGGGKSGLYRVIVRDGGHLASFQDGSGYLGATLKDGNNQILSQARLQPLAFDPTMLFMAAALMNINQKLDSIQQTQKEIIEYLEQKDKSEIRGNLNFLRDVLDSYKYNWNNEKFKNSHHIKILDIKQEAEKEIIFIRERIEKRKGKISLIHRDRDVKEKIGKMQAMLEDYHLILYIFAFASFLEVMLLENFDSEYLTKVSRKIEEYSEQYRKIYTECYEMIESDFKTSLQSHVIGGLASFNKTAGNVIAKIPVISKSQIDESLVESGEKLSRYGVERVEKTMDLFMKQENSAISSFVDNINAVNSLYNRTSEIIVGEDTLYFPKA